MQRTLPMLLLVLAIFFGGIAAYMASGWLKAKSLRPIRWRSKKCR